MNIESLSEIKPSSDIPEIAPGDTVKVRVKLAEGDRQQRQQFQGTVIRIRRAGIGSSFTVRRVAHGVGVERTFPMYSPLLENIEVVRKGKVRRAKLFYLRGRSAKASRIREKT
jgi:large subunit ribosomal protein L19